MLVKSDAVTEVVDRNMLHTSTGVSRSRSCNYRDVWQVLIRGNLPTNTQHDGGPCIVMWNGTDSKIRSIGVSETRNFHSGKRMVEAQGKRMVEAQGKRMVEAQGKRMVEAQGKRMVEAQGGSDHIRRHLLGIYTCIYLKAILIEKILRKTKICIRRHKHSLTVQITFIFIGQTHLNFGKRVCTCARGGSRGGAKGAMAPPPPPWRGGCQGGGGAPGGGGGGAPRGGV